MKMTRAEKRRRKIAKIVEMQLDGLKVLPHWKHMSYDELYNIHRSLMVSRKSKMNYYGASLADMVLNQKAQQIQAHIDKQIFEELNGKTS